MHKAGRRPAMAECRRLARRLYRVWGGLSWLLLLVLAISCLYGSAWVLTVAVMGKGGGVAVWGCRLVSVCYGLWLWYDWKTPFDGSTRRSAAIIKLLWPMLKAARDFLPAQLICDFDRAALPAPIRDGQCPVMLCCHPHGIFSLGILTNFAVTGGTAVLSQPVTLLTLDMQFYIPLWRELCIALGLASVSRRSTEALLRRRRDLLIVLGGARESLDASPGHMELIIRPRRGFFRLALKHGAAVFPVLTLGECELYNQIRHPRLRRVQLALMRVMSFALPIFWGRFGPVPAPLPLKTIVGPPLLAPPGSGAEPNLADIRAFQELYIQAVRDLYAKHAPDFYQHHRRGGEVAAAMPTLVIK